MRTRAITKLEIDVDVLTHGMKRNLTRQTGVNPPRQPGVELREPAAGTKRSAQSALDVVQVLEWEGFTFLRHGFSTRTGGTTHVYRPEQRSGELNLGFTASDVKENVEANRGLFVAALDRGRRAQPERGGAAQLVTLKQIHSSLMVRVGKGGVEAGATLQGDGLMTDEPGVLIGIQTADCTPVLVVDRKRRAVAAFHAGWRGTLKRIVETGIGRMRLEFNSRPEDLTAAIGPGVGQCCYAIGEEVLSEFESQFAYAADLFREVYDSDPVREKYPLLFMTARAPGHGPMGPSMHLDLAEANRRQLLDAGLTSAAIHMIGECTSCRTDRYFSHRAERGFTGRMLSAVGIV